MAEDAVELVGPTQRILVQIGEIVELECSTPDMGDPLRGCKVRLAFPQPLLCSLSFRDVMKHRQRRRFSLVNDGANYDLRIYYLSV